MSTTLNTVRDIIDKILENEGPDWNTEENSYRGIMPETYKEFCEDAGSCIPHPELGSHPKTVYAFYEWYLDKKAHVSELPGYFRYMHADFCVNAPAPAVKIIQGIVGAQKDGVWGSKTRQAVAKFFSENTPESRGKDFVNKLLVKYNDERQAYYKHISAKNSRNEKYLKGWLARCERVLKTALHYN
ncbi:hypothetical protein F4167_08745, partial [Candidatus Poribacteria bacterium]|nr:hypothetical protein [Candidatus Poribacteria bacterium]